MALASVQHVLARLFTEDELRTHYFADPIGAGRALGLDDAEAIRLAALTQPHVEQFAETLKRKRIGDLRHVLPLTASALGPAFGHHARAAMVRPPPAGRRHDDARALVAHLAKLEASKTVERPWVPDLARYELTCIDVLRDRSILLFGWYRYPVGLLATMIDRGLSIGEVRPRWTVAAWLRAPGSRTIRHWIRP